MNTLIKFLRKSNFVPLLAECYCRIVVRKHGRETLRFAPDAMELLVNTSRPGNIRHMLNIIEQCVEVSSEPVISRRLLIRVIRLNSDKLMSLNEAWKVYERDYLERLLKLTEGDITLAASLSQRNPGEFCRLLRNHGLAPENFRKQAG